MDIKGYRLITGPDYLGALPRGAEIGPIPNAGENVRFVKIASEAGAAAILNILNGTPGKVRGLMSIPGVDVLSPKKEPEFDIAGIPDPNTVILADRHWWVTPEEF